MLKFLGIALILTILLLYPSTYLFAGTHKELSQPQILLPLDQNVSRPFHGTDDEGGGGGAGDDGGNGSKGDADDLAGILRGISIRTGGNEMFRFDRNVRGIPVVRLWWVYFFIHKLF